MIKPSNGEEPKSMINQVTLVGYGKLVICIKIQECVRNLIR